MPEVVVGLRFPQGGLDANMGFCPSGHSLRPVKNRGGGVLNEGDCLVVHSANICILQTPFRIQQ